MPRKKAPRKKAPRKEAPVLPPELVGLIAEHLSGSRTLRFCALVSRTWAIPCQRALFRDLRLEEYLEVVRLPAHLLRYPHLQRLIQHVSVCQTPENMIATKGSVDRQHEYVSGLISLFPLISHIPSLDVTFDRERHWDTHDQQFVEAFHTFLQQSESLKVLATRCLQDERDIHRILSFLDGTQLQRLTLDIQSPFERIPADFFSSPLTLARLPSLQLLRIDTFDTFELDLNFLRQHPAMFPKLKHLEIVVYDGLNLAHWLEYTLKPAALCLESFRLELTRDVYDDMDGYHMPIYANLFDGLQFKHLQLLMFSISRCDAQAMIDWFAAMFRHLVDAGSTIHFTELTFTFPDRSVSWDKVDDVLSHAAFGGVKQIHFEKEPRESCKGTLITNLEHPELVSVIRDEFPCLASRGFFASSSSFHNQGLVYS